MTTSFVSAGFGGQGILFAGSLLAYAAMDEGLQTTWIPSYGPEMRGGTAYCYVVISETFIGSPIVRQPDVALIFNGPSFNRFESAIAPGGLLVYNTSLIEASTTRQDIRVVGLAATDMATEAGDVRMTNMVMLGALLQALPILTPESIKRALRLHLLANKPQKLEANCRAFDAGAATVAASLQKTH